MAQGFRVFVPWDPVLILSQIVALQGFFYLSLGIWILLVDLICAFPATLDQLFSYHEFEGSYSGWFFLVAHLLHSATCAFGLMWIVQRAKQCLDFAITVGIVHIGISVLFVGFPWSWWWWGTNIVGVAIMTVAGEYLCMRSELALIPLSGAGVK